MICGALKYLLTGQTIAALAQRSDGALWNGSAYVAPAAVADTAAWRALLLACPEEQLGDGARTGVCVTPDLSAAVPCTAIYFRGATPTPADAPVGIQDLDDPSVIADAILDRSNGVETGKTVRQTLRIIAAMLAGKVGGEAAETSDSPDLTARPCGSKSRPTPPEIGPTSTTR